MLFSPSGGVAIILWQPLDNLRLSDCRNEIVMVARNKGPLPLWLIYAITLRYDHYICNQGNTVIALFMQHMCILYGALGLKCLFQNILY